MPPAGCRRPSSPKEKRRTPASPPTASSSPKKSPARAPASPSPRSNRASSPFTPPTAPAPPPATPPPPSSPLPPRPAPRPACDGLGENPLFDEELLVPTHALSIKKGAVVPWAKSNPPSPYYMQVLGSLAREFGFSLETPWRDLPEEVQDIILYGTKGKPVTLTFVDGRKSYDVRKPFEGVIGNLNRRLLQTESAWMREELSKYQSAAPCETCNGARLRPEPLAVKIAGEDISQSTRRSVRHALDWFSTLEAKLTPTQQEIARV